MKEKSYSQKLRKEAAGFLPVAHSPSEGVIEWSCPSNIAIVKYWGKKKNQLPLNPSLSMTLEKASTRTRLQYHFDPARGRPQVTFRYEGKEMPSFEKRVKDFLGSLSSFIPCLSYTRLSIDSSNTFPHSSGIASSASAMGALALCLVSMEHRIMGTGNSEFMRKSSFIARLGSGSASRSVYPGFSAWGTSGEWPGSNDEYAVPFSGYNKIFEGLGDSILIVDKGKKQVSSSAGHGLMEDHPFATARYRQASSNFAALLQILKEGDWNGFIALLEEEALALHAMMMSGRPGYMLMQPGTLSIIQKIRSFRADTGTRTGFTLDAGANVHLLYAAEEEHSVREFIATDLIIHCEDQQVIHDRMGGGPREVLP